MRALRCSSACARTMLSSVGDGFLRGTYASSSAQSQLLQTLRPVPHARRALAKVRSARKKLVLAMASTPQKQTGVLFVCLGNICRSPAAEAVFKAKVEEAGLSHEFRIDSCGTGGGVPNWYKGARSYHEGGPADERMMAAASKRGVDITSLSRPLQPEDLQSFDYILGMDFANQAAIQVAADYWAGKGDSVPTDYRDKVSLMCTHLRGERFKGVLEVPDPYWDESDIGFNKVLDMLEDSCQGLLDSIQATETVTPVLTQSAL